MCGKEELIKQQNKNKSPVFKDGENINDVKNTFAPGRYSNPSGQKETAPDVDAVTKTRHNTELLRSMIVNDNLTKTQTDEYKKIERMALGFNYQYNEGQRGKKLKEVLTPERLEGMKEAVDFFLGEDRKDTGMYYDDLKNACMKFESVSDYILGENSDYEDGAFENAVNAILELYETAHTYVETHSDRKRLRKSASVKRYELADNLSEDLSLLIVSAGLEAFGTTEKKEKKAPAQKINDEKEYNDVKKKVSKLSDAYRRMETNITGDRFDTPEQKMRNRLSVLESCMSHIDAYDEFRERTHRKTKINKEVAFIKAEYERVTKSLSFIKWAKRNGKSSLIQNNADTIFLEKRIRNEESVSYSDNINEDSIRNELKEDELDLEGIDDGLTDEQLRGIEENDRWLLRNFNNGGLLGSVVTRLRCNRSQFVTRLLSMSKRERLYMYYMIETGKRKSPDKEDLIRSQSHVPDLDAFKDQIIAPKWKFMNRAFGDSYTYWHKLDQAMELLGIRRQELIQMYSPRRKEDDVLALRDRKMKARALLLNRYIGQYKELLIKSEELDNDTLGRNTKELADKIRDVLQDILEDKTEEENNATKEREVKVDPRDDLAHLSNNAYYALLPVSSLLESIAGLEVNVGTTATSIAVTGNILTTLSQITALIETTPGLTGTEIGLRIGEIAKAGGATATTFMKGVKVVSDNFTHALDISKDTIQTTGQVISGAALALRCVEIGNNIYKGRKVTNAKEALMKKYANKQKTSDADEKELRYDKNMVRLSSQIHTKEVKACAINTMATAFSTCAAFCPFLAVGLTPISIGLSIAGAIIKAIDQSSVTTLMFDDFFGVQSIFKDYLARKKGWLPGNERGKYIDNKGKVHDETELKVSEEGAYLANIRNRICRMRGFTDLTGAATMIGSRYATFIIDKLFKDPPDPDRNMYVNIVNSLGLKVKNSKDESLRQPQHAMLAMKLTGRV